MANEEQAKELKPSRNIEKAATDKKSQVVAATKVKKSQPQSSKPRKRWFTVITDIVNELKKVVWPSRQETVRLSLIVIGLCLVMGAILGLIDWGFSELVAKVLLGGQ